jgi:hypothetical protein
MVRAAAFTKSLALIHTQCVLFLFHFQNKKTPHPQEIRPFPTQTAPTDESELWCYLFVAKQAGDTAKLFGVHLLRNCEARFTFMAVHHCGVVSI